ITRFAKPPTFGTNRRQNSSIAPTSVTSGRSSCCSSRSLAPPAPLSPCSRSESHFGGLPPGGLPFWILRGSAPAFGSGGGGGGGGLLPCGLSDIATSRNTRWLGVRFHFPQFGVLFRIARRGWGWRRRIAALVLLVGHGALPHLAPFGGS